MDPFTQGALGGAFSQSFSNKKTMAIACFAGICGGLAPDLDIVIGSDIDPLLSLEYHRHFTHSIWFIPFGGALVAGAIWLLFNLILKKDHWDFKTIYKFATLGYATHATLDACTSYGTRLFWPLSNARVTWDTISIIDPLVTIPLIVFVIFSAKRGSSKFARIGMGVFFFYMSLGFVQNARVTDTIEQLAADRGHQVERIKLNPTIGNLIVWRAVYQYDGNYYVNAVVAQPFKSPSILEGTSVPAIDPETIYPEIGTDSVARNDIRRFNYFAQGYLFEHNGGLADLRYSAEPHKVQPIWGIRVDRNNPDHHVEYGNFRGPDGRALDTTWDMMWGDYTPEQKSDIAP
ncbi:metal-dependent hydrolase [Pseudemcibacter aquimaris]|uniref:metal-dependent hydrolase n=1 Tax=Pseudemcibacter aquimaris TaxID=2857064 RepID=UPI0020126BC1|nr:metal-dependent hydrolase [Pseudemcibacter aquimaris]MCC3860507.1 metal-dependent hydrolase [Pseudemcibacter aquimaris]WDU59332.1 metal-dependent hydrolase [Pseudemcibacter aquimaris]